MLLVVDVGNTQTHFGLFPPDSDQVSEHWRVTLGYDLLWWNSVVRPGDQIDRAINTLQAPGISGNPPSPLVGLARPAFFFNQDDYWAHGLSAGLELRY